MMIARGATRTDAVKLVRDPWTYIFCAAALATVTPVWIGRYLPLVDYPNHLSNVFVLFNLHRPEWNFAAFYAPSLVPLPYWLHYASTWLLSFLFGPETAFKVVLSLMLLALPAGVARFARALNRDPRLALFAFPLGWNFNLATGLLAYCFGLSLLFFALTALLRHAERPSLQRGLLATLAGVSLYLSHILPWVYFLVAGVPLVLLSVRPLRRRQALSGLLPLVPAFLVGSGAYLLSSRMAHVMNPSRGAFQGAFNTPWQTLQTIPTWTFRFFTDHHGEWAGAGLLVAWALLLVSGLRADPTRQALDPFSTWGRIAAALLVAVGLLFLLPRTLVKPFYWWGISMRYAVVAALLLFLTPPGRRITGSRGLFLGIAALVSVLYPLDVAAHFYRFNQRMRDFDAVLEALPRGQRTLPLMYTLSDPEIAGSNFVEWGSYIQVQKGGYVPSNLTGGFPLRELQQLPAPPCPVASDFRWELHGKYWDYFFVLDEGSGQPFRGVENRVRLVKRAGRWSLWQRLAE
jgi:hypothetical protein